MILQDEGLPIEAGKVNDLMRNAGLDFPEFYAKFFVSNMLEYDIEGLMKGKGGPGGGAGGGDTGPAKEIEEKARNPSFHI